MFLKIQARHLHTGLSFGSSKLRNIVEMLVMANGMGKAELHFQRYGTGRIIKGFSHCEEHREADQKRQSLRIYCHSQPRSHSLFVFIAALFSKTPHSLLN